MKFMVYSTVCVTSLAVGSVAHAQNSVTLYGVVDTGFAFVHNVANPSIKNSNTNQVASINSSLSGTRWGMRGSEDLGGGLNAIFQLESGFKLSTGTLSQGGRLFGRQAYVGLSDKQLGTLTMGRQYDPLKDLIQPITADGVWGTVNVTPGDLDNYDNSLRVNNSIKYVSPELYGVQMEALYGVGGVAGDFSAGQTAAVAVAYKNQGLSVATGFFTAKYNPSNAANNSSDTISDSLASSGYAASASSLQIARVAAAYVAGPVTFGGSYSNTRYKPAVSSVAYSKTESFNSLAAFVNYSVTPAALIGLSYSYTNSRGAQSAIYNQLSAGAEYLLSKRTAVYALVGYQRSSGDTFNGKAMVPATASVGDAGFQSATGSQLLTIVGLRHRF